MNAHNQNAISLELWFKTSAAQDLLRWESERIATHTANIFGYHALQLGLSSHNLLAHSRIPHHWRATQPVPGDPQLPLNAHLACRFDALPIDSNGLDLLVMAHSLEQSADPHAALREAARILRPEGKLLLTGFNPISLWGLRNLFDTTYFSLKINRILPFIPITPHLPSHAYLLRLGRLKDWLKLLDFEIQLCEFALHYPFFNAPRTTSSMMGAVYLVLAVKRVPHVHLITPAWRKTQRVHNARGATVKNKRNH